MIALPDYNKEKKDAIVEKEKLEHVKAVEWFKARTDSSYKEEMLEWEKKRIQLEGLQLLDNNKQNDEIQNT